MNKKLENNPEKLEDALKVMRVLSTVEGTSALYPDSTLKAGLLPFKDAKADDTYYADISDFINAGNTTPFIYSGWENTIVNTGTKMLEFMQDKASIKDVADQLDEQLQRKFHRKAVQSWWADVLPRRPEVTLRLYPLEHGSVEMARTRTMVA